MSTKRPAIQQEIKRCTRCKKELPTSHFYKQKQKTWEYYDSMCISCRLEYSAERALNIKKLAIQYKGGKCEDCGLIDHPNLFDFHHLNPQEKEKEFGEFKKFDDESKKELDKCILLCSNCHRRRHIKTI